MDVRFVMRGEWRFTGSHFQISHVRMIQEGWV